MSPFVLRFGGLAGPDTRDEVQEAIEFFRMIYGTAPTTVHIPAVFSRVLLNWTGLSTLAKDKKLRPELEHSRELRDAKLFGMVVRIDDFYGYSVEL